MLSLSRYGEKMTTVRILSWPRTLLFSTVAICLFMLCRATLAQDAPTGEELQKKALEAFNDGLDQFDAGNYQAALEKFQEANALRPHPSFLYNIAWCQSALGQPAQAIKSFDLYLDLAEGMTDEMRAQVDAELAALSKLVCEVHVTSSVKGVEVTLDKLFLGETPLDRVFWRQPGDHTIHAVKSMYEPLTLPFFCAAGEKLDVALAMQPSDDLGTLSISTHQVLDGVKIPVEGCSVTLDGELVGTTPWKGEVVAGMHAVGLRYDTYMPATGPATVKTGASTTLDIQLEPDPSLLALAIDFDKQPPEDAVIDLDGTKREGAALPFYLSPGTHALLVFADGYHALDTVFWLSADDRLLVSLVKKDPKAHGKKTALLTVGGIMLACSMGFAGSLIGVGLNDSSVLDESSERNDRQNDAYISLSIGLAVSTVVSAVLLIKGGRIKLESSARWIGYPATASLAQVPEGGSK